MSSQHLAIDEFFTRLTSLFESHRTVDHGSIFLTQKRLTTNPSKTPTTSSPTTAATELETFLDLSSSEPLPILMHATDGKSKEEKKNKIKISTVVQPDQLESFYIRYADVCKTGMQALKKRDRSGKRKAKAKKEKGKGGKRKEGAALGAGGV